MNKKLNKQSGITLIALVITIIVMLILVAVTISMAVNGGLFNYAGKVTGETQNAINAEQELADGRIKVGETWYNSIDDYLNDIPSSDQRDEKAEANTSYVGYYADTNNDGTVDGIIYADLAKGETGEWGGQTYTIPTETEFKEYYISKKNYEGPFGKKDVVSTKETGNDRFYVMALTDYIADFSWDSYGGTNSHYTGAETKFGKGKENTNENISNWSRNTELQEKVGQGWFIPSSGELAAFAVNIKIDGDNYLTFKLSKQYWSSSYLGWQSIASMDYADTVNFETSAFERYACGQEFPIRLSTTF